MNITIYSKHNCPNCSAVKAILTRHRIDFEAKMLGEHFNRNDLFDVAENAKRFPIIMIDGDYYPNLDDAFKKMGIK